MKREKMNKKKLLNRLKFIAPVSLFFVFTTIFYGPLSLYLPNSQELWFDIGTVFKVIVPLSLITFFIPVLISLILPKKLNKIFTRLVFGGSLALYIQGNFANIDYGVLDGRSIDWNKYSGYAVIDTALWVFCLALPFIFDLIVKKTKKISALKSVTSRKIMIGLSIFLFAVQVPAFAVQISQYKPSAQGKLSITTDGMFELSEKDNTILFVVDALDEKYLDGFLKEYPDYFDGMDGFVKYDNALTAGARTIIAMPIMFSGQPFTKDKLYSEYLDNIWTGENVLTKMKEENYDVRIFSGTTFYSSAIADSVDNFETDNITANYRILAVKLYKLTLFKFAPHLAKRLFVVDTAEFVYARNAKNNFNNNLYTVSDKEFIKNYRKNGFSLGEYDKAFRCYYFTGSHKPYKLGADAKPKKNATVYEQTAACMLAIKEMLLQMKELGVYDNATIVITADHGYVQKAQHPGLLIKQAGAKNDAKVSSAPVSLFDIPVLLADSAGVKLENQKHGLHLDEVKEGMERERYLYVNANDSSKIMIKKYRTSSTASDVASLELLETFEDKNGAKTPYVLGERLLFNTEATGNRYTVEGFGGNTGFRTIAHGPHVELKIPIEKLPSSENLIAKFEISVPHKEYVQVIANGKTVFEDYLTKDINSGIFSVEIPCSVFDGVDDNMLTLQLNFPEIDEAEMEKIVKDRTFVMSFRALCIEG